MASIIFSLLAFSMFLFEIEPYKEFLFQVRKFVKENKLTLGFLVIEKSILTSMITSVKMM